MKRITLIDESANVHYDKCDDKKEKICDVLLVNHTSECYNNTL